MRARAVLLVSVARLQRYDGALVTYVLCFLFCMYRTPHPRPRQQIIREVRSTALPRKKHTIPHQLPVKRRRL